MSEFSLPRKTLSAYVLPSGPLAALGLPLVVYVAPFYVSGLGLDQSQVGLVLLAARLLDLVLDPWIGWASDVTRTRWGRRRPWLAAAVPMFVVGVYLLFLPPDGATIGWFAAWVILSYLAYSVALINHMAWGAELSGHYHERSRIQGWREFGSIAGFLLVLALPVVLEAVTPTATIVDKVALMGWFICLSMPVCVAINLWLVPEPKVSAAVHRFDVREALRLIGGSLALRKLLLADLFQGLAAGVAGSMFIFVIAFYFGLPAASSTLLFLFYVSSLVFVPMWIKLSYRFSKHRTLCAAVGYTATVFPLFLLLPRENVVILATGFVIHGVSASAAGFLLRAMMADVIDDDFLRSGQERSGLHYSLLVMTNKLGFAGAGLVFPLLAAVGFDPRPGVVNSPEAILGLGYVYGSVPALFLLMAVLVMWNFPLDEARQRELRSAIERRHQLEIAAAAPAGVD